MKTLKELKLQTSNDEASVMKTIAPVFSARKRELLSEDRT
jgi:hypothetical protein